MKIWRVAHDTVKYLGFPSGPYAGSRDIPNRRLLSDMFSAHSDAYHPSPSWDRELGYIFDHEHCGFNSREALYEWFADYTRVLSECGFRVFVYDVADEYVRVGSLGGQAIFDRCAAIEKSREDLDLAPAQLELFA